MYKWTNAERRDLGIAGHGILDIAGVLAAIIVGLYMYGVEGCGGGIVIYETAIKVFGTSCAGMCLSFGIGSAIILIIVSAPLILGLKLDPYLDFHSD